MRATNNDRKVSGLLAYRVKKLLRRAANWLMLVGLVVILITLVKSGWISPLLPEDAGPTELTVYDRMTLIEKSDFQCNAPISSVFATSSYDPGWQWGPAKGGQAYVIFEVVGDFDLCIWAQDYTLNIDADRNLVVDVERIDVRRPRIDLNPRVFNGVEYQTFRLVSADGKQLANANIDREAIQNVFRGTDSTYVDQMQKMLLVFGANQLTKTTCFPQAIEVMRQGVYEHFMALKPLVGFEDVVVNLPDDVSVPADIEYIDSGDIELEVIGEETCYVN